MFGAVLYENTEISMRNYTNHDQKLANLQSNIGYITDQYRLYYPVK